VQRRFNAIPYDDESGVGNVQVRIVTESGGEERGVAGLRRIAIEKISIVEIAVGSGTSDRFGRLVDRIVVTLALCQRQGSVATSVLRRLVRRQVKSKAVQLMPSCRRPCRCREEEAPAK